MNGVGKSQQTLTNVAPIAAYNWCNIGSLVALLLNKGGGMPLISCGNSLPKHGTLARGNVSMMQCLFLSTFVQGAEKIQPH